MLVLAISIVTIDAGCRGAGPGPLHVPRLYLQRYDTIFAPGHIVFAGNLVDCVVGECQLLLTQSRIAGHFRVGLIRAQNLGTSAREAPIIIDSSGSDQYDPTAIRLSDSSLLLAFHSDGAIRLRRSVDEARSWTWTSAVRDGGDTLSYSEAFLRLWHGGIVLAYAAFDPRRHRSHAELRWSSDGGRSWSSPVQVGDMGVLDDGSRPSIGPINERGGGLVAFSQRDSAEGVVRTLVQLVDFTNATTQGAPRVVALDSNVGPVGTFPLVIRCGLENLLLYSVWHRDGSGELKLADIGDVRDRTTRQSTVLARRGVQNGFGRLWLSRVHAGLEAVLVESPSQTDARITRAIFRANTQTCYP